MLLYVEDIGIDVMGELHDRRAAMIRAKDRVSKQLHLFGIYWNALDYYCLLKLFFLHCQ